MTLIQTLKEHVFMLELTRQHRQAEDRAKELIQYVTLEEIVSHLPTAHRPEIISVLGSANEGVHIALLKTGNTGLLINLGTNRDGASDDPSICFKSFPIKMFTLASFHTLGREKLVDMTNEHQLRSVIGAVYPAERYGMSTVATVRVEIFAENLGKLPFLRSTRMQPGAITDKRWRAAHAALLNTKRFPWLSDPSGDLEDALILATENDE